MDDLLEALEATGRVAAFSLCAGWDGARDRCGVIQAAVRQALGGSYST